MEKETRMKSLIVIIAIVVVLGVAGFMLMRNRFGATKMKVTTAGQITLLNDSSDTMSVEYKFGGKNIAMVLPPREKITCGSDGLLRIFTSDKAGAYEITYPIDMREREIKVSQVVAAGKKKELEGAIATEKGMIGDIKVMYEEPRELD